MAIRSFVSYQTRIGQLVSGLVFIGLGYVVVSNVVQTGSGLSLKRAVAVLLGMLLVLLLDKNYWLLVPALIFSGVSIPGLPLQDWELASVSVIGIWFFRSAVFRSSAIRFNRDLFVAVPVFSWIVLVFCLNPAGMSVLGTENIGGRFYLKVFLGFFAMLVLSTFRFTEHDAKLLFSTVLASVVFGFIYNGFIAKLLASGGVDEIYVDDVHRGTRYELLGGLTLIIALLSRFSIYEILHSAKLLFGGLAVAAAVVYTGKRRAFGSLGLLPILRVVLTGRDKAVTFICTVVAVFLMAIGVSMDGTYYELPSTAKRSLSVVFPQYRANESETFGSDYFREEMRKHARAVISQNPWFGRKGFSMDLENLAWTLFANHTVGVGHAASGNWHSTWYAFAADFGIPCMLLWAVFNVYVVIYAIRGCRTLVSGTYLPTCCLFLSMLLLLDFAFSYTTGHSALTSMQTFVQYGLLLAVVRGYRKQYRIDPA